MFTGIIKKRGIVKKIISNKKETRIGVRCSLKLTNKDLGSSINCSGVCLTLEKIRNGLYYFHLTRETLRITNFNNIKLNQIINLEKSLKYGNEISGHLFRDMLTQFQNLKKNVYMGNPGIYIFQ